MLLQSTVSACLLETAPTLQAKGISDHAPTVAVLVDKRPLPAEERPISKATFMLAACTAYLDAIAKEVPLEFLSPIARLQSHKHAINTADQCARDEECLLSPESNFTQIITG